MNLKSEAEQFGKEISSACTELKFGRINEEQQRQVKRIIRAAVRFRNIVLSIEGKKWKKRDGPNRSHEKWTDNEDKLLLEKFKNCIAEGESLKDIIDALAENHQRSVNAIESRLQRYGAIEYEKALKRYKLK